MYRSKQRTLKIAAVALSAAAAGVVLIAFYAWLGRAWQGQYAQLTEEHLTAVAGGALVVIGAAFAVGLWWWLARLRTAGAIPIERFVPYYQPIVDLKSGRLLGAEVLARWPRSDGSIAEPADFANAIESVDFGMELTRSLMRRVKADLSFAVGKRPEMTLSFNVGQGHFDDALIIGDIGTIFDGSSIKLTQIILDLADRNEIEEPNKLRRVIAALQSMGCKIAIGNAGRGQKLAHMLQLGVDIIKIDKSFIHGLETDQHSKAVVDTLVDLAKSMRMEIVAVGVENITQVMYLRELGVGVAQGHLFAPPLPAPAFLQLVEAMDPCADAPATVVANALEASA